MYGGIRCSRPPEEGCVPSYTGLLQLRDIISLHRSLLTLVHEREASFRTDFIQLTPHDAIIGLRLSKE